MITAHHEAGHAVAAVMRGGSTLRSVTLSKRPGEGVTWMNAHVWDSGFQSYAGPWAEARHLWTEPTLAGIDEQGRSFDDLIAEVLFMQPSDALAVDDDDRAQRSLLQRSGLPAHKVESMMENRRKVWTLELEAVLPAIREVARMLLDGLPIDHTTVHGLVDDD